MADAVHAVHDGNDVVAFSGDSDIVLYSNQAVFESID